MKLGKKRKTYLVLITPENKRALGYEPVRIRKNKRGGKLLTTAEKVEKKKELLKVLAELRKSQNSTSSAMCYCGQSFRAQSKFQKKCPACRNRNVDLPVLYERAVKRRKLKYVRNGK